MTSIWLLKVLLKHASLIHHSEFLCINGGVRVDEMCSSSLLCLYVVMPL